MVAKKGRGWVLAPSLVALVDQVDYIAPNRSKASDGSIGDQRHKVKNSDHNPTDGHVTAVDVTHDPDGGFDAGAFAESLRARRDSRVKYVIFNKQIFRSYGSHAWDWTKYTGANAHKNHVHVSVKSDADSLNSADLWFEAPQEQPRGPIVRIGSHGEHVKNIQTVLEAVGDLPGGRIDGIYGPNTQAGVRKWQQRLGVTVDGIWGPETQAATDRFFQWIAG